MLLSIGDDLTTRIGAFHLEVAFWLPFRVERTGFTGGVGFNAVFGEGHAAEPAE